MTLPSIKIFVMKKIKLTTKKLKLSKETIADLSNNDMMAIYGGSGNSPCLPTYGCGTEGTNFCPSGPVVCPTVTCSNPCDTGAPCQTNTCYTHNFPCTGSMVNC